MGLLYYKYRSYYKYRYPCMQKEGSRVKRGERDPGEPNKSQRKFNYIGIVEKKKTKQASFSLKRAAKNTKEENVALHRLVLIQRFCKPGKLSFSPFWHFNYIRAVASVCEQLMHACSLDQASDPAGLAGSSPAHTGWAQPSPQKKKKKRVGQV